MSKNYPSTSKGKKIFLHPLTKNLWNNPLKTSNLNPIKPKVSLGLFYQASSTRILNPKQLPKEEPKGIKVVDFGRVYNNNDLLLSKEYIEKCKSFKVNPTNFTHISTLPGCIKAKTINDDYKEIKSRNSTQSHIDCLNNTLNKERSSFRTMVHSNNKKRNDSANTKSLLQPQNKSYLNTTSRDTYKDYDNTNRKQVNIKPVQIPKYRK